MRDDAWFDQLFTAYSTRVFRYICRRAARVDADDLTAEVFTTAWRRREQIPSDAELPWLYKTAGFVVANHHRKLTPIPIRDATGPENAVAVAWPAHADDVKEVLGSLSARDQQVLLLAAWEGLAGEQLAVALGVSRGAADTALSRARARLREAWARSDASAS